MGCCWASLCVPNVAVETEHESLHDLPPQEYGRKADRKMLDFASLKGKVVLVVNVASYCGLTQSNYRDLVPLYAELEKVGEGFEIIAFPCAQFLYQEPRGDEAVQEFCTRQGVAFPVMDKCSVNGKDASEVYDFLKVSSGNTKPIEWNFGKFLVGKDGTVIKRYPPNIRPSLIKPDIVEALAVPRR